MSKVSRGIPICNISSHSEQGARDYQEDRMAYHSLPDGRLVFVLCDGHGGSECAQYAIKRGMELMLTLDEKNNTEAVLRQVSQEWDAKCVNVLGKYPEHAAERKKLFEQKAIDIYYTKNGYQTGTTMICCVLDPVKQEGNLSYVGDSRCIWKHYCNSRTHLRSTKDHKPNEKDLGKLGGTVTDGRINGILAVGRVVGDNCDRLMGSVSHEPMTRYIVWKGGRFKMVMATDGVWDVMGNPYAMVCKNAHHLVQDALNKKSTDNVTAIVVELEYPDSWTSETTETQIAPTTAPIQ